jgi:hypothetical protein
VPKIIRFRDSAVIYRVGEDAPWYVFDEDVEDFLPVADLTPGKTVRWPDNGHLVVESVEEEEADEGLDHYSENERPLRMLAVGDEIGCIHLGSLVVASLDFANSFVSFTCGTRLAFPIVMYLFTHQDGADIALPENLRQAVPLRATARQTLTVYHLPQPGWYELPGIGPYNFSESDPDTYVSVGPHGLTSHDGPQFRAMFDIGPPEVVAAETVTETVAPPSLRERLIGE